MFTACFSYSESVRVLWRDPFQRQNQLNLALQELGRIERTLFMLDWLESPQLRQLCQAGLGFDPTPFRATSSAL